ncbi:MAG: S8 family serine peptidase [Pseudomonadota bacterium]
MTKTIVFIAILCSALVSQAAMQDARFYGDRIIVKMDNDRRLPATGDLTPDQLQKLAPSSAQYLSTVKRTALGADVLRLSGQHSPESMEALVREIGQRPGVAYAHVDYKRYPAALEDGTPNDPRFNLQWYLRSGETAASRFDQAWQRKPGGLTGAGARIAVIDTGWTRHIDQDNDNVILRGPDFISADSAGDYSTAGDGDGRDPNGEDIGDRVSENEKLTNPVFRNDPGCRSRENSSWHGTLVSSIVAASTDNGSTMNNGKEQSIAGAAPGATVVSVRALGKCGGYTSDITDAALWAAGIGSHSPIAPINEPVDIINLSLGGGGACTQTEQETYSALLEAGVVTITASGNDGGDATNSAPGNCSGTINVAAATHSGAETAYTNTGYVIDITAPGGNDTSLDSEMCDYCIIASGQGLNELPTASDWDTEDTQHSATFAVEGTSFAAPLVTSAIALLLEEDPELSPQEILGLLTDNVRSFPADVSDGARPCTTERCGAGLLDIHAATIALQSGDFSPRPFPDKSAPPPDPEPDAMGPFSDSGGGGQIEDFSLFALLLVWAASQRRRR